MAFTKINAAGIGTTETVTVDGLTVINDGSFGGNLTVSGVLTYEDVTNVDSVGLITARNGIVVGSGITLSKDGDIFATGITTVSGNVKVGTGITLSPDGDVFATGVVTATSYYGDGSNLSNITSTTINSNADNRIITGSGTANTLNGESNLTFDGTELKIGGDSSVAGTFGLEIYNTDSNEGTALIAGTAGARLDIMDTGSSERIRISAAGAAYFISYKSGDPFIFQTHNGSSVGERLRIDSTGRVLIGTTTEGEANADDLTIAGSGHVGITIRAGTTSQSAIYMSDGTSGDSEYRGNIIYDHNDDHMRFATAGTGRFRITSGGEFLIGRTSKPNDINKLVVTGTSPADAYDSTLYLEGSETDGAINTGGALAFGGHDGTSFRNWANIYGMKENGTSGNTAAYMAFHTRAAGGNPTERLRIQSDGNVVIGTTSASSKLHVHSANHYVLTSSGVAHRHIHCSAVNGNAGEYGGAISFSMGSTGAAAVAGVQGAADADNVGLAFITHNSGTGSADASEMMRITSAGLVAVGDAISGMDMGFGQQLFSSKSGTYSASILGSTSSSVTTSIIYNSNTSFGGTTSMCDWRAAASNSSAWYFLRCSSSSASDNEFFLAGDGNAYADGSWSGGGADYAEYFEWSDGNTSDEDRRGMTVVLDGTKIKIATSSDSTDNIIGVVSGNPSMIGDAAYCKWTGKYQRDDYNSYVRDSNGARVLNSDYDDTKTYLPRKDRKEWDAIGMVGKLRVRKGQQTGTRWIKMKDVSDTIEEWLVR